MALLDYPIISAPTISQSSFHNVLVNAGSPMAAESNSIYAAFTAKGVNPAIGLAIAQHESGFGKLGIAVGRNNPYGDRYYNQAGATNKGGWAAFTSYTAAAKYEAGLLASSSYGSGSKYNTARTFAYRYAPSSDGNSPANYGSAVVSLLQKWGATGGVAYKGAPAGSTTAKSKATTAKPAAKPTAAPASHKKAAAVGAGIGGAVILALIL